MVILALVFLANSVLPTQEEQALLLQEALFLLADLLLTNVGEGLQVAAEQESRAHCCSQSS